MASLSLHSQIETNLMSNREVIELLLQLMNAKDHGKNYIKVKPHLQRNCLLFLQDQASVGRRCHWALF